MTNFHEDVFSIIVQQILDLCNYHLTRGLHRTTVVLDIAKLFNSLNVAYDKPTERNLLQQLGVMRLVAAIEALAKCQSNISLSTFCNME